MNILKILLFVVLIVLLFATPLFPEDPILTVAFGYMIGRFLYEFISALAVAASKKG